MLAPEQLLNMRPTVLKHAAPILVIAALAACNSSPRLDPGLEGLSAPDSVGELQDGLDGLVVGDRLMDAGQHELALRAYYRAGVEDGLTVDVITAIGAANLALGRLGQAEEQFRAALQREPDFVPALNNLGAVLMEQGEYGEARLIFQQAFALDSGQSETIRENLRLAIARMENQVYVEDNEQDRPGLIRRGGGRYTLTAGQ